MSELDKITNLTGNIFIKRYFPVFFFTSFWFLLLFLTGTLNSGLHFTDDHILFSIQKMIHDQGIKAAILSRLDANMHVRFSPVSTIDKIPLTILFGTNAMVWSYYHLLLTILTSLFLFKASGNIGISRFHGYILCFMVQIGEQSAIIWRLSTGEILGMLFFSASLFFLSGGFSGKRKQINQLLSVILLILSSLSKESFILLIPSYVLSLLWFDTYFNQKRLWSSFCNNLLIISIVLIIFVAELWIIFYQIGLNNMQYAGIDQGKGLIKVARDSFYLFRRSNILYIVLFGGFLMILNYAASLKVENRIVLYRQIKQLLWGLLFMMVLVFPQYYLYNKSGLYERYLLPMMLGFAFPIILTMESFPKKGIRAAITRYAFTTAILLIILFHLKTEVIPMATRFASEGRSTRELILSIQVHTCQSDSLLVIVDPIDNYEWTQSLIVFLDHYTPGLKTYLYCYDRSPVNDFESFLKKDFLRERHESIIRDTLQIKNFKTIAILPSQDPNYQFFTKSIPLQSYKESAFTIFKVYNKL
ncbi:MAG: hypothetical protein NTU44_15145 [Bacteroidetes bacterium]|nr:hypothetical protein [Bacteroidota bacterium]